MRRARSSDEEVLASVKVLYFDTTDEFEDVQEHVDQMSRKYKLTYIKYNCESLCPSSCALCFSFHVPGVYIARIVIG